MKNSPFTLNTNKTRVISHLVMIEKSSRCRQNSELALVLQSHQSEREHNNVKTKGEESYLSVSATNAVEDDRCYKCKDL